MKVFAAYRRPNTNSIKVELQTMFKTKIEVIQSKTQSHHDEVIHEYEESKQQLNHTLYVDMTTKMNCILNKLNQTTQPVTVLPSMKQSNEVKLEEYAIRKLLTSTTDSYTGHTLPATTYRTTSIPGHTFQTIPYLVESEVECVTTTSSAFPLNDRKHSIIVLPASAAPLFHGKHSESPMQFLTSIQEYFKLVHSWESYTLLDDISQFLRESALEWYCQLRVSHRRPQTWAKFTELFLTQFNPPIRKARREREWHECKQEEYETINEFLVRFCALWQEQKPHETESDLVKHLFCRMRSDILNMIRIPHSAPLDKIIAEVQHIEEILHRRVKVEGLSSQLKQLSLQNIEILPHKHYNKSYLRKTTPGCNNQYSIDNYPDELKDYLRMRMTIPNGYLTNRTQRIVDKNTSQQLNSCGCYSCRDYGHSTRSCPTQYEDYQQKPSKVNSKKRHRRSGRRDQSHFYMRNSAQLPAQLLSPSTNRPINMNPQCIFCNRSCSDYCCSQCNEMDRGLKFKRLLQCLDKKCSQSIMYYDEINSVVETIRHVSLLQ